MNCIHQNVGCNKIDRLRIETIPPIHVEIQNNKYKNAETQRRKIDFFKCWREDVTFCHFT